MTGRHARGRHSAATIDLIQPLADLIRDTGGLPAVTPPPDPMNPRADLPPIPPEFRDQAATWATPPGDFDAEILHTVRLGEIHAEPPTWGGRGVRL